MGSKSSPPNLDDDEFVAVLEEIEANIGAKRGLIVNEVNPSSNEGTYYFAEDVEEHELDGEDVFAEEEIAGPAYCSEEIKPRGMIQISGNYFQMKI